jgi:hypothetical protein
MQLFIIIIANHNEALTILVSTLANRKEERVTFGRRNSFRKKRRAENDKRGTKNLNFKVANSQLSEFF